jgi:amino acid transporter
MGDTVGGDTGSVPPAVAVVGIEEHQLLKAMHWYDGFVVALANPGFLLGSLGFTIGSLGGLGAVMIWGLSMFIAVLQNKIWTEPATMFPDRSGGLPIYAFEGWRRYFTPFGAMAAVGYWFAWSTVLAIFGLIVGSLIQTQWFAGATWKVAAGGIQFFTLPKVIAIALILLVWVFNTAGVRPAVWVGYVTGVLLMIPLFLFCILPYFTGHYHGHFLTFGLFTTGVWSFQSWKVFLAWMYIAGWSSYGVEACATFAPEYEDSRRDTALALRRAAMFSLLVYLLLPLGLSGVLSQSAIAANPVAFYAPALDKIVGIGADFVIPLIIASLFLSMNSATMDGSRALYGISRSGLTIRWLGQLNRFHVPGRAMTVDMVVNVGLVILLNSTLQILATGNLGYILTMVLTTTAVLLMRKDRPSWPRPIRLARGWLWVAGALAAVNALFIAFGSWAFGVTGYGSYKQVLIGIGVEIVAILLFIYRRVVQDKQPFQFRDMTVEQPDMSLFEEVVPAARR